MDVENYLRNLQAYIASKYNKFKIAEDVKPNANYVNDNNGGNNSSIPALCGPHASHPTEEYRKRKIPHFDCIPCGWFGPHARHAIAECRNMKEAKELWKTARSAQSSKVCLYCQDQDVDPNGNLVVSNLVFTNDDDLRDITSVSSD